MLLIFALIFPLLGAVTGWTMCLGQDECYSVSNPFGGTPERPFQAMPVPIPVRWFLWTSCHQDEYQELFPADVSSFSSSRFDVSKRTVLIIHGYTQSALEPWIADMCKEIFKVDDVNCVTVDWSSGSLSFYAQAANNMRYVGTRIARFMQMLEDNHNYSASNVHIIGHSMGCQIAGFAGKLMKGVSRITGLDPAAPYFEGSDSAVRLDRTDAMFVDVIHTSAEPLTNLGLGYIAPVGHLDIYPNGGGIMPECEDVTPIKKQVLCLLSAIIGPLDCSESIQALFAGCEELVKDITLTPDDFKDMLNHAFCGHFQSIQYYKDSITNPEKYRAYPCNSLEDCLQGRSEPCPEEGCQYMGHHARPTPGPQTCTLTTA